MIKHVKINDELHLHLKIEAAKRRMQMGDLAEQLIREGLERLSPSKRRHVKSTDESDGEHPKALRARHPSH